MSDVPKHKPHVIVWLVAALCVVLLSYDAARRPVDFPVYYAAARAMLSGTAPIYGPQSGIGWPQVYRYPPLFLLLFVPFALLPSKLAATAWALLKFVPLYFVAHALFTRLGLNGALARFLALCPAVPYLAVEFHYGNAQFFVFALVAAALLWLDDRPLPAALALALGISVKVWPLFFLPYLFAAGYRRVAVWTLAATLGSTLLPTAFFGPHRYSQLLEQWGAQELGVAATAGEPGIIGFPSQSLHSVMMRYLVALDYSKLTDPHYPKFNLADLDPRAVEWSWVAVAGAGYASLLFLAYRRLLPKTREPESRELRADTLTVHAVAFCGLVMLEPFTQNGDLVVLLWPILVAASLLHRNGGTPNWARAALWLALALIILKALVPATAVHRALQVLGMDFWLTCLLTAGLIRSLLAKTVSDSRRESGGLAVESPSALPLR